MGVKKILVLGGTGMLGHVLFRVLSTCSDCDVSATVRNYAEAEKFFSANLLEKIKVASVDIDNFEAINQIIASIQPHVVINCIGLVKQLRLANDPLPAITINAQLPHRIALACRSTGAKMIHFSTDCVYSGKRGMYTEADIPDAEDLYGRTKYLGEVNYPHCLTLRTSIIGHELKDTHGLIGWFLSQNNNIKGFTKAIFSGLPTIEIATIIKEYILPNSELSGTYNVSSDPVSKYKLLVMVAEKYGKSIQVQPSDDLVLDRSLNSTRFRSKTGYRPPTWEALVERMHQDYKVHLESNYAYAGK